MNAHPHPHHKIQRTISHDSSLKPKQQQQHRQHLSSLTTTATTSIGSHKQEQIRLLAKKLAKKLATSSSQCSESKTTSPYYPHHLQLKRRTSVCKNVVFEFEEDQDLANAPRQQHQQQQQSHAQDDLSDVDDDDDDDESSERREDKENFVLENIGKRISSMAVSIVAKDGRELFGEMPSRKIPMAKILQQHQ